MIDDDGITSNERSTRFLAEHRLTTLIVVSIMIALAFAAIGLTLYNTSGTAQLDLSRPGLEGIDKQITSQKTGVIDYPSTGAIDEKALLQFETLYKKQLADITSVDAFGGDPMAPDALGIDEGSQEQE